MPKTYTQNLGITKPAEGEEDGVWGDLVNENMDIVDRAINGSISLTLTGTSSTLTTLDGDLSNGQYKVIRLTGTPSGTHTITITPNTAQKVYFVYNTTAQSVVFTQGSGGNVTIAAGDSGVIYSSGVGATSAVVNLTDHFAMNSVNITGGSISGVATIATTTGVFGLGAVGTPSITFTGDTNTGIFSPAADTLAFVEGGVEAMRISSFGNVGIGTTNPGVLLDVNGRARVQDLWFSSTSGQIEVTAGDVVSFLDLDFTDLATVDGAVRFFRNTNTTGAKTVRFFRGDGSANEDARIAIGTLPSFFGIGGGSVGIGVSNPVFSAGSGLQITRADGATVRLQHTGTNPSAAELRAVDGSLEIYQNNALPIRFGTNATFRMALDATGNLGVGTTAPTNFGANYRTIQVNGTNGAVFRAANATATVVGDFYADTLTVGIRTAASVPLLFETNSVERMRIDTAGNVGIGLTSPAVNLDIGGSAAPTVRTLSTTGTVDTRMVSFGGSGTAVFGTFSNHPLVFFANNGERLRLHASGGVSINNFSDPGAGNLSVTGNILIPAATTETRAIEIGANRTGNGTSFIDLIGDATYSDYGARLARGATGANTDTILYHRGTGALQLLAQEAGIIALYTSASERVRLSAAGDLGVGTTNPLERLHVNTASGAAGIRLSVADVSYGNLFSSVSGTTLSNITAAPLIFSTTNTERMRITSAGDLGVGTTAPTNFGVGYQTIQVNATNGGVFRSSNTAATAVGDFYADNTGVVILRSATNVPLTLQTNSVERFRIGTAGQLGIGGATYGTAGQVLTSGGPSAAPSWTSVVASGGTVTSVAVSGGTTGLTTSGGPVTTSGTITLAGTLALTNGGTGATTDVGARSNLGLGTMATQGSSAVTITGGSITGITDLTVADGGTGASDAATARTNLGLAIGTNVQAYDAGLQSIAGLTTVADRMIYTTASDVYAVATLTAAGRAILDDADAAAQRTTLGLAIGTNVQAWDANLDQIAALAPTADNFIVGNGSAWTLETPAQALASLGVTATATELNFVDGVTSAVQTQLDAKVDNASLVGQVSFFARNTAPTGWLKANGAVVSRTTYATLFAAIGTTFGVGDGSTTFGLPDLRGEFLRGWDDGRGVDTGRVFGSAQSDDNKSHIHTGTADSAGAHTHTVNGITSGSQGFTGGSLNSGSVSTSSAGAHTHTLTIASSGGTEARPRNIALLACIKF